MAATPRITDCVRVVPVTFTFGDVILRPALAELRVLAPSHVDGVRDVLPDGGVVRFVGCACDEGTCGRVFGVRCGCDMLGRFRAERKQGARREEGTETKTD